MQAWFGDLKSPRISINKKGMVWQWIVKSSDTYVPTEHHLEHWHEVSRVPPRRCAQDGIWFQVGDSEVGLPHQLLAVTLK